MDRMQELFDFLAVFSAFGIVLLGAAIIVERIFINRSLGVMTVYVYVKSDSNLWTVGFYDPKGNWHSESDHDSKENAASRVKELNGGTAGEPSDKEKIAMLRKTLTMLQVEMLTLAPRLTERYARNVNACIAEAKDTLSRTS